jgi:hypothetical protein
VIRYTKFTGPRQNDVDICLGAALRVLGASADGLWYAAALQADAEQLQVGAGAQPTRPCAVKACLVDYSVRSHCRFRNRGTEYVRL